MTLDRYTKFLLSVFAVALFLNGLNPWIQPPEAGARENAVVSGGNADCSLASKNSIKSLEAVNDVARLLGYIESSVNEVKVTVNGIDRKMNEMPSFKSSDRR